MNTKITHQSLSAKTQLLLDSCSSSSGIKLYPGPRLILQHVSKQQNGNISFYLPGTYNLYVRSQDGIRRRKSCKKKPRQKPNRVLTVLNVAAFCAVGKCTCCHYLSLNHRVQTRQTVAPGSQQPAGPVQSLPHT